MPSADLPTWATSPAVVLRFDLYLSSSPPNSSMPSVFGPGFTFGRKSDSASPRLCDSFADDQGRMPLDLDLVTLWRGPTVTSTASTAMRGLSVLPPWPIDVFCESVLHACLEDSKNRAHHLEGQGIPGSSRGDPSAMGFHFEYNVTQGYRWRWYTAITVGFFVCLTAGLTVLNGTPYTKSPGACTSRPPCSGVSGLRACRQRSAK